MGSESSECAWSNSNLRWFGHQSRLVRGPLGAAPGPAAVCPWSTGHFAADAPCAFNSDFASDVNSVPLLAIQFLLIGGDRRPRCCAAFRSKDFRVQILCEKSIRHRLACGPLRERIL